jgi:hypothetical protein
MIPSGAVKEEGVADVGQHHQFVLSILKARCLCLVTASGYHPLSPDTVTTGRRFSCQQDLPITVIVPETALSDDLRSTRTEVLMKIQSSFRVGWFKL